LLRLLSCKFLLLSDCLHCLKTSTNFFNNIILSTISYENTSVTLSKLTNLTIRNKYNLILIIINKLIKYLYIIICKKKFIVKQLKYIILN